MLKRLRERAGSESGFTLIELLVVMLILGILAAIAIPAFLNQKSKASDSQAKAMARSMQTAMETCSTDESGVYTNCTESDLIAIEATIGPAADVSVTGTGGTGSPGASSYRVTANAPSTGNAFWIERNGGTFTRGCSVNDDDRGGCPGTGTANGTW
jgi:type IV pilus assembly protein PilA